MRWLLIILVLLLLGLQVRLWVGEGSLAHQAELDGQLALQKAENESKVMLFLLASFPLFVRKNAIKSKELK